MTRRRTILAILAASAHALPKDVVLAAAGSNDVCPSKDLVACSSSLPSGFCCPQNVQCQALAGNTTALCCPNSSSCDRIQPIGCDVRLQDPKNHADAVVITSVFDVDLEACGKGCCPFGYTCDNSQCVLDKDQSKKPGADGKSTTATATSSSSTSSSASSAVTTTTTPASSPSHTMTSATATPTSSDGGAAAADHGMKSNTMSIIGGVAGGALVCLILVILAVLYLRRRKRTASASGAAQPEKSTGYRAEPPSSTASAATRGLNISEPIVQQESSYRTDFMLKSPSALSSISNQPVNSRWSGSGIAARARNLTPSRPPQPSGRHLSIPNPFTSPNPSTRSTRRESAGSSCDGGDDDHNLKTGHVVNGRLAPIRGMRSSKRVSRRTEPQHVRRDASEESINVFADENAVPPLQQQQQQRGRNVHDEAQNRMTTFSDLMEKAQLGDVNRGKRYVPGTTPRI